MVQKDNIKNKILQEVEKMKILMKKKLLEGRRKIEKTIKKFSLEIKISTWSYKLWLESKCQFVV